MQDRPDRNHLGVKVDGFPLANLSREQPRSHSVIEEIGFREFLRKFQRVADQRRVRHADAC
jgi:hypothetical protein